MYIQQVMPANRRMFFSGALYEIIFRARSGLPMPARPLVNQLILSALARTQRDHKVILCGVIFMANHCHILAICQDTMQMANFYGELKKKLTDAHKRIVGKTHLDHLSLWEDITKVPVVLDFEMAKDRFAYLFANPACADLVDSIEEFTGVSSWEAFRSAEPCIFSVHTQQIPWIRLPTLRPLSSLKFSRIEERELLMELEEHKDNQEKHRLEVHPFAWLKVFGHTAPEKVAQTREEIIKDLREREAQARKQREMVAVRALGKERLLTEGISYEHKPKERGKALLCLSSIPAEYLAFRALFKAFVALCERCYQQLCRGELKINWPLAAFKPPQPRLANPLWAR